MSDHIHLTKMQKGLLFSFVVCMMAYLLVIGLQFIYATDDKTASFASRSLAVPLWNNLLPIICLVSGMLGRCWKYCKRLEHGVLVFVIGWDVLVNLGFLADPSYGLYFYLINVVNSLLFELALHYMEKRRKHMAFGVLFVLDVIFLAAMEAAEVFIHQRMGVPIESPVHSTVFLRSGSHFCAHGGLFGQVVTVPAGLPEEQQMALVLHGMALLAVSQPLLHNLLYMVKHMALRFLMVWTIGNTAMFSLFGFPSAPLEGAMPIADVLLLLFENGWRVVENTANISIVHTAGSSVEKHGLMPSLVKGLEHEPKELSNTIYAFDYFISGHPSIERRSQGSQ